MGYIVWDLAKDDIVMADGIARKQSALVDESVSKQLRERKETNSQPHAITYSYPSLGYSKWQSNVYTGRVEGSLFRKGKAPSELFNLYYYNMAGEGVDKVKIEFVVPKNVYQFHISNQNAEMVFMNGKILEKGKSYTVNTDNIGNKIFFIINSKVKNCTYQEINLYVDSLLSGY